MKVTSTHSAHSCPTCRRLVRNARRCCRSGRYALVADQCGDHEVVVEATHG